MKNRVTRAIAATAILGLGASSIGCGYFLYPERRGNEGGHVDGGTLVMDLLWLIPGIVPGIVALIVDFSSGAIYVNGRSALRMSNEGNVALRVPDSVTPTVLEFRLVTASRQVLAHHAVPVGPNIHDQWVELDPGSSVTSTREKFFFEVLNANGRAARLSTPIEVNPL